MSMSRHSKKYNRVRYAKSTQSRKLMQLFLAVWIYLEFTKQILCVLSLKSAALALHLKLIEIFTSIALISGLGQL